MKKYRQFFRIQKNQYLSKKYINTYQKNTLLIFIFITQNSNKWAHLCINFAFKKHQYL